MVSGVFALLIASLIVATNFQFSYADSVIATIAVGEDPAVIAFDSANGYLYVVIEGNNTVMVIDGATNTVVGSPIPVGSLPQGIAFDSVNGYLYVVNILDSTVTVIDGSTNTVVGSPIPVGSSPQFIASDSTNGYIYVPNSNDDTVTVIDGSTNTVLGSPIPVGDSPQGIAFDPANGYLYVITANDEAVIVIDGSTNTVVGSPIPVGPSPAGIAFDSANGYLYVTNGIDNTVTVIDGSTNTVVGSPIPVGSSPFGIAFDPANGYIYVTNSSDDTVTVIDGATNTVVGSPIPVGQQPEEITFDSANGYLYVSSVLDDTVSVISPTITVDDTDPAVLYSIIAPDSPIQVNTQFTASASFTDDSDDIHTATWDWGDGNTTTGTVTESGGSGSVQNTHSYTIPGIYTVTLTVNNSDGAPATEQFQYVVAYDPNGGFVTGGGWINSPEGAYTANPSLTGKASFGFNSKYQNGAQTPNGNTEFYFKVANLNFHSTSYDWLVIAGAKAQYKGTGTINGAGNYKFMLTAIDGAINGGGGVDKFRIKITDSNSNLVYDNLLDAPDSANPTTILGGGNIVIHKS